jgi:branched-chain amino acid transport system permease protein
MIPRSKIFLALGIAAAFVLTKLPLNSYLYNIVVLIGVNIILAVGLNLVNGFTGQFSLGHAGFMAVGAYASAAVTNFLGPKILPADGPHHGWAAALFFIAALVAGGLAAAVAGLCVGVPSLRLKGDYLAIVTLGFGEIIRVIIQNTDAVGASRGWSVSAGYTNLFWTYALAAVTIYIVTTLVNSTYGRGFLAVRDDEIAAEAVGINTTKFKVIAFVIGAFFAGIAGGLYAHYIQYLNPSGFDFMLSAGVVVMVILGGMGSTTGVILAAALLTLLPEALRWFAKSDLLDTIIRFLFHALTPENFAAASARTKSLFENRMIFYSLLLIIFMLTRPQGLFGDINAARRAQPDRTRRKG